MFVSAGERRVPLPHSVVSIPKVPALFQLSSVAQRYFFPQNIFEGGGNAGQKKIQVCGQGLRSCDHIVSPVSPSWDVLGREQNKFFIKNS